MSSVAAAGLPFARLSLAATTLARASDAAAGDELYARFRDPAGLARPFVRWWWNGGRIVKEELLRELDVLQAAGIGGVEINAIQFPETADPLHYRELRWLSDEWIELVKIAVAGAKQRGLVCDIIVGSGWPFGAEDLAATDQTQMLALGTKNVTGPQRFTVAAQALIDEVNPPVMSKRPGHAKQLLFLRLAPAFMEEFNPGLDLGDQVRNDTIAFDVPPGEHVLYFLVKLTGFESVIRGAPGASGPVLNHYSKTAVQAYLDRMSNALTPRLGRLGDSFRACFVDSLELEGANWCDDMLAEFARRRGYALEPYLPFVLFKTGRMGRALPEAYGVSVAPPARDMLERARYDFEITKMELFRERFLETFTAWCRQHGVQSRVQAYGREMNPIDASMSVDLPDSETWIRADVGRAMPERESKIGRAYSPVNKFVASGARLAGKRVVTCEEVTNTELVFNAALDRIKVTGDHSNLSGVTHSILHGFNYSPPDAPFPGWVRYGTFFNERNPWWPYFRRWVDYKARLSALFQNGIPRSDVAVLHPFVDLWSRHGAPWDPFPENVLPAYAHNVWEAIHQNGSGCDYVSESVLQRATFAAGGLSYGERRYGALLLLEVETIAPETAQALRRYAEAGGKIIFVEKRPHRSAGLHNRVERDRAVADAIDEIERRWPEHAVVYPAPQPNENLIDWYQRLQDTVGLRPCVRLDRPRTSLNQVCYRCGDRDVFFFANGSLEESHAVEAAFAVEGKTAWIWDPETGERFLLPTAGAPNRLRLTFAPAESKVIVFDRARDGEMRVEPRLAEAPVLELSGFWRVELEHVDKSRRGLTLEALVDFNTRDDLRSFAGVIRYTKSFEAPVGGLGVYVDLGQVFGVSEVSLNGRSLGCRWYGRHLYALGDAARSGENTIEIKVTTTLGNYLKGLPDNKDGVKWLKRQPFYPAGLIGPVRFRQAEHSSPS